MIKYSQAQLFTCNVCGVASPPDPEARADTLTASGGMVSFGTNGAKWFCCGPCRDAIKAKQGLEGQGGLCPLVFTRVDVGALK